MYVFLLFYYLFILVFYEDYIISKINKLKVFKDLKNKMKDMKFI